MCEVDLIVIAAYRNFSLKLSESTSIEQQTPLSVNREETS